MVVIPNEHYSYQMGIMTFEVCTFINTKFHHLVVFTCTIYHFISYRSTVKQYQWLPKTAVFNYLGFYHFSMDIHYFGHIILIH